MIKFLFLFVFVSMAIDSQASAFYVSQKKGNDRNNGLSIRAPKKTIQAAANLTKPGDTVYVMDGNYSNDCETCNVVDIITSGTADKYIIYTNYPGQKPRIRFDGWAGFSIRASYIKVSGFEIVGNNNKVSLSKALRQPRSCRNKNGEFDPKYNGNGIAIDGKGSKHPHHIIVSGNVVRECGGGGISASQADYVIFEDNVVYDNSWYTVFGTSGISLYQFWNYDDKGGYHNIIRRNKCYNNKSLVPWFGVCRVTDGNGIIIDDFRNQQNSSTLGNYRGRTLIENNICWYNGGTGIHTFQSDHVDIVNNTAYANCQSRELNSGQILAGFSDDISIVNNILVTERDNIINSNYKNSNLLYANNLHYNKSNPYGAGALLSNLTCINGLDPMFISPGNSLKANFGLKRMSPAINKGSLSLFSEVDFYKRSRKADGFADIGALEF